MSPYIILSSVVGYFALLLLIAWYTSRNASSDSYFIGNKQSPWYIVAFGLIGDSLSGVTFISVPGAVGTNQFSYMQMVLGYVIGYLVISQLLLPLYYRLNLTSIYSYLHQRFGTSSQKSGSFFFLVSRLVGAAFRLYIALIVLDVYFFSSFHIPFALSAAIVIALILLYTYKGGIKTLVWTDTLQSGFLLLGVIFSIYFVCKELHLNLAETIVAVKQSPYSQIFFFDDWMSKNHFIKQFMGGMFIAIVMTGLDQNMMQKNLSCRSLGDAQKNIRWFSVVVVFINLLFVSLGALLYLYAQQNGLNIPAKTDQLFPSIALNNVGGVGAIVFILGITAATFSSADSVLTTLTTSFCIDFLGYDEKHETVTLKRNRQFIHIGFAVLLLLLIVLFKELNNDAVINQVFKFAGYTYGPLLGMFAFGLFSKRFVMDKWVPFICLVSPIVCYVLDTNSKEWFGGYQFGNELLIANGLITFVGLMIISRNRNQPIV
ncbi:MAG: sodium:solute symporter [Bacteroidota bacterium]